MGEFGMWNALRCVVVAAGLVVTQNAFAGVQVKVDISSQRMQVYVNGDLEHVWKVSTGRRPFWTPRGTYRPKRLEKMWYSRKYNNSPMPHSIFFRGGYAIHGTNYNRQLGRPASHGCVRLSRTNAARLFRLVRRYGAQKTKISIRN